MLGIDCHIFLFWEGGKHSGALCILEPSELTCGFYVFDHSGRTAKNTFFVLIQFAALELSEEFDTEIFSLLHSLLCAAHVQESGNLVEIKDSIFI